MYISVPSTTRGHLRTRLATSPNCAPHPTPTPLFLSPPLSPPPPLSLASPPPPPFFLTFLFLFLCVCVCGGGGVFMKYQPHLTTSDVYFRPNRVKPMSNTDVASFRSAAATSREPWRPGNDNDDQQDGNNAAVGQRARLESGSRPNRPRHSPSPQRLVSRCRSGQRPGAGEEIAPPPGRRRSGIVCR